MLHILVVLMLQSSLAVTGTIVRQPTAEERVRDMTEQLVNELPLLNLRDIRDPLPGDEKCSGYFQATSEGDDGLRRVVYAHTLRGEEVSLRIYLPIRVTVFIDQDHPVPTAQHTYDKEHHFNVVLRMSQVDYNFAAPCLKGALLMPPKY
ncbi:MAG: hypothetical protein KW806_01675 [Candidatus Yanofskybacteria bacterium]|nr:hypothetical protein [Candidatus Yanofskybacteria bacterium]